MDLYVIGVDNGGTVSKAALFDTKGREIAVASRKTPVVTPQPGYTERDMEALYEANCACIREVVEKSGVAAECIAALAVGGHGKGLYAWGKDGHPACNGIISTDNRAWQYPERWKESGVFQQLYPQLCQQLIPSQQASLLAWLKEHNRAAYDNTQWVFSVKDYIRFRLTGEAYCEATDISGSGLMDVRSARFDPNLLEALGIPEVYEKLAPLKFSADTCGGLTVDAATLTGLKPGTPVAGGMFDIDACAIAMAVTKPEQLAVITGTWSINEFISPQPSLHSAVAMNSLYAIPGFFLLEECSATSAGNLEWVIENCIGGGRVPYERISEMVASVDPAQCNVYYLPFLYGSNAHPLAKASFVGLTTFHHTAHMLRAVFEGVAYSHKTHVDRLLSVRPAPAAIRMAGGVVNSAVWTQIFADVLGFPLETVAGVTELGALGCAMAAAVTAGVYRDYSEAAQAMVRVNRAVEPDMARHRVYAEKYETYASVSRALETVWDRFAV